jgi:protoporphyrinogen oxidase
LSKIVVLGAGASGLACADLLRSEGLAVEVLEERSTTGGSSGSFVEEGQFTFDRGIHGLYTTNKKVQEFLIESCQAEVLRVPVRIRAHRDGWMGSHPAQCHLSELPRSIASRIAIELKARLPSLSTHEPFPQWCENNLGQTFTRLFEMPYARKFWGINPDELASDWMHNRVARPTDDQVSRFINGQPSAHDHYVKEVFYPRKGGFGAFLEGLTTRVRPTLNSAVLSIDLDRRHVRTANRTVTYDRLASSIPLKELVRLVRVVPREVRDAAEALKYTSAMFVNIGLDRVSDIEDHWIYDFDPETPFSRLSSPAAWSPENVPQGFGSLQAEIYFSGQAPPEEVTVMRTLNALVKLGKLRTVQEPIFVKVRFQRYANIIHDLSRAAAVETINQFFGTKGLLTMGRYGRWNYDLVDDAIVDGWSGAASILAT